MSSWAVRDGKGTRSHLYSQASIERPQLITEHVWATQELGNYSTCLVSTPSHPWGPPQTHTHRCTCANVHRSTHAYTYTHVHRHVCTHGYIRAHLPRIHTHTRTPVRTQTHTLRVCTHTAPGRCPSPAPALPRADQGAFGYTQNPENWHLRCDPKYTQGRAGHVGYNDNTSLYVYYTL